MSRPKELLSSSIAKSIMAIDGVARLCLADEPLVRFAVSGLPLRYKHSWLYCLRCSRDDNGNLGFRYLRDGKLFIIGVRNQHVYITPLTPTDNPHILRHLCRLLSRQTQFRVIVRKAEFDSHEGLPFSECVSSSMPLEDDQLPETILDFRKLFTRSGELTQQAARLRRKVIAFGSRAHQYEVTEDISELKAEDIDRFFSSPSTIYKRQSYQKMIEYLKTNKDSRYGCMIFRLGGEVHGLYLFERFSITEAGLYCSLTTRNVPGITEWMDYYVFRKLYDSGVQKLLLGGAEKPGVDVYINKLLAYKTPYRTLNYLYRYTDDLGMTIRQVRPADFRALSKLYADFYNELDELGERWTLDAARKFISHFYARQPDLCFVAEKDDQIIGAVMAAIQPWWDGNHLVEGELLVHSNFKHYSGYATGLLEKILTVAEQKYQAVTWDTIVPAVIGHPFRHYEQLGFYETPVWKAVAGDVSSILRQIEAPVIRESQ